MATSSCKTSGEFRILISKAKKKKKNFFCRIMITIFIAKSYADSNSFDFTSKHTLQ